MPESESESASTKKWWPLGWIVAKYGYFLKEELRTFCS